MALIPVRPRSWLYCFRWPIAASCWRILERSFQRHFAGVCLMRVSLPSSRFHRNHFGKGRSNMPALKLNAELHLTIFSLWPGGALSLMRRIKCFRRVPNWRISSSPHQSCIGRKTGRITIFRSSFSGRLVRRRDACRAGELRGCRGREARCAGGRNDRAGRGPCRRDSPFRWPW